MPSASSTALARLAALQEARGEAGDVVLSCEGGSTRAHASILTMGSDYFQRALSKTWVIRRAWAREEALRRLVVRDCPAAVLAATIDWMYGVEIPEDFGELEDLLRIADMFLMEELKEEVGRRLGLEMAETNYR